MSGNHQGDWRRIERTVVMERTRIQVREVIYAPYTDHPHPPQTGTNPTPTPPEPNNERTNEHGDTNDSDTSEDGAHSDQGLQNYSNRNNADDIDASTGYRNRDDNNSNNNSNDAPDVVPLSVDNNSNGIGAGSPNLPLDSSAPSQLTPSATASNKKSSKEKYNEKRLAWLRRNGMSSENPQHQSGSGGRGAGPPNPATSSVDRRASDSALLNAKLRRIEVSDTAREAEQLDFTLYTTEIRDWSHEELAARAQNVQITTKSPRPQTLTVYVMLYPVVSAELALNRIQAKFGVDIEKWNVISHRTCLLKTKTADAKIATYRVAISHRMELPFLAMESKWLGTFNFSNERQRKYTMWHHLTDSELLRALLLATYSEVMPDQTADLSSDRRAAFGQESFIRKAYGHGVTRARVNSLLTTDGQAKLLQEAVACGWTTDDDDAYGRRQTEHFEASGNHGRFPPVEYRQD